MAVKTSLKITQQNLICTAHNQEYQSQEVRNFSEIFFIHRSQIFFHIHSELMEFCTVVFLFIAHTNIETKSNNIKRFRNYSQRASRYNNWRNGISCVLRCKFSTSRFLKYLMEILKKIQWIWVGTRNSNYLFRIICSRILIPKSNHILYPQNSFN